MWQQNKEKNNVEAGFDIDRAYKEVYNTSGISCGIIEEGGKHE